MDFHQQTKTKTTSNMTLHSKTERIIEKYKTHLTCTNLGRLLLVLTDQKMNTYLKEIADLCKIQKKLTCHIVYHAFATTITLFNVVSIRAVSKMLGNKSIKTTQHYSNILDEKVSERICGF